MLNGLLNGLLNELLDELLNGLLNKLLNECLISVLGIWKHNIIIVYTMDFDNMDYLTLVNLLRTQITPMVRKQILDKLTEINNNLLKNKSMKKCQTLEDIDLDDIIDDYQSMNQNVNQNMNQNQNKDQDQTQNQNQNQNQLQNQNQNQSQNQLQNQLQNYNLDEKLEKIKKLHSRIIERKKKKSVIQI